MKELVDLYFSLRRDAECYGDEIGAIFGVEHHEFPAGFFGIAFNNVTLTLELLDYYRSLWEGGTLYEHKDIDKIRDQNGQRVNIIQEMGFISLMSSFEFSAKNAVIENKKLFGEFKGRIYLSSIMEKSRDKGLLASEEHHLWDGVIKLRNILVHNNGISDINKIYNYPDLTVTLKRDSHVLQENFKFYALLSKWLLIKARIWFENANK